MRGLRYVLQVFVMLFDLILIGVSASLIWRYPTRPDIWIVVGIGFWVWQRQGGFMAWNPKEARQFLANAKKQGW